MLRLFIFVQLPTGRSSVFHTYLGRSWQYTKILQKKNLCPYMSGSLFLFVKLLIAPTLNPTSKFLEVIISVFQESVPS